MKFIVPSKTLHGYASAVARVINSKNALQILNNLHFRLKDGYLTITSSDVENAISARFAVASSEGEGSFCLDARRIVDLLKELPAQPLSFDINDENLEVNLTYPDGNYQMVALPGDQFPEYRKDEDGEEPMEFDFPAGQFLKGIENTLFATGTDDFHPQMMGILLDIKNDGITFVATDTRKLARYINNTASTGIEAKRILPAKPAGILKTILPKDEPAAAADVDAEGEEAIQEKTPEMVHVTMTTKSATFETGNYRFNCRFIKGNFPDYNRVIPTSNPYILRVDRVRFLNAVRRVGVFVDPGFGMEKFRISSDRIEIRTSDNSMLTAGHEVLDCEYQGPDLVIGFSAPYLIETCNTLSTEQVIVKLADPSRPGVIIPTENPENTDLLVLLMPMSVQEF